MKSEKAKQYLKNNREEVEINWETGETAWMIWPKDARKARAPTATIGPRRRTTEATTTRATSTSTRAASTR